MYHGPALTFTNVDMTELKHRLKNFEGLGFVVNTLHSVVLETVGINFMVRYAIKVPGTKRVIKVRKGGSVYEHIFVDVAIAQERLRDTVARSVYLTYTLDPFINALGNKVFHAFDIYVHIQGFGDYNGITQQVGGDRR